MDKESMEVINITQQTLRLLMVSLGTASKADFSELGNLLHSASLTPDIDPVAKNMLQDLASGASALGGLRDTKQ